MNTSTPLTACSDLELLLLIQQRDRSALTTLYGRFGKTLLRMILSIVHDPRDAEDLLQEVFLQIWRNASTYRPDLGTPRTWIFRIAQNRAIDLLRSKHYKDRMQEVGIYTSTGEVNVPDPIPASEDAWTTTIHREHMGILTRALTALPPENRTLIELAFYHGYSHTEIAALQDIPLGTVKTRIRNGILYLRTRLGFLSGDLQAA